LIISHRRSQERTSATGIKGSSSSLVLSRHPLILRRTSRLLIPFHFKPTTLEKMKSMESMIIMGVAALFLLYTSNLTNQTEGNVRRPSRDHGWSDQRMDPQE